MITVLYGALLVLGLALLVFTVMRVLLGGIAAPSGDRRSDHPTSHRPARRILDERYAAGEMTTEEYRHRLRALEGRN
jgi:putative membrane protein